MSTPTSLARGCQITMPVPPSANRWHRRVGVRTILSEDARAYMRDVAHLFRHMGRDLGCGALYPTQELRVEVRWFRERRSGDIDKRGAIMLDALQGIAYADDKQIADYRIIRDDSQRDHPRMVVTITPLDGLSTLLLTPQGDA